MVSGNVFNIQRFCTDDGDGIRTTVFLKGCPLDCLWCHNPESKAAYTQMAYSESLCINCGVCAAACPNNCHVIDVTGKHSFDRTNCLVCKSCSENCPTKALEAAGQKYTVEDVIKCVLKDRDFYKNNGGMTLSGGEPLMQPEFSAALAKEAKKHGINVCIETSGFCKSDTLIKINEYTDCFLFDYKCSPVDYKKYTGVEFELIEKNLEYAALNAKRVVLRCPIIAECIRKEHFDEIGDIAKKYGIKEIELLPYHNLGLSKCDRFGIEKQTEVHSIDKDTLEAVAENIADKYKVKVKVR